MKIAKPIVPAREAAGGTFCKSCTSDSKPRVDLLGYRRYRLHKVSWILKAPRRVFLEERLKENDEWLWDTFDFFERQRRVLMLVHYIARSAPEWCSAGHHLPECHTERIHDSRTSKTSKHLTFPNAPS